MPLNLASPGIVVREVDLTFGRTTPASNKIGAIVAPFAKGPVEAPILIENEQDLLNNFGEPYAIDKHYEHWLSASSYLAYGGALRVVRADDADIKNAYVGSGSSIKIKSLENYNQLGYDENVIPGRTFVAQNPGSWANGLTIGMIDAKSDQILVGVSTVGLSTGTIQVGYGITQSAIGKIDPGIGTTTVLDGFIKGIITDVSADRIEVKVISYVSASGVEMQKDYQPNGIYAFNESGSITIQDNTTSFGVTSYTSELDWFDQQSLGITTSSTINWNSIVERPSTTSYAEARGSRFDELHIIVIDSEGKVTGNTGTILEKFTSLSKAKDAIFSVGSPSYWRKFLASNSRYVFGGSEPAGIVTTGFEDGEFESSTDISWDQNAEGIQFGGCGSLTLRLKNGLDYNGQAGITNTGSLTVSLAALSNGYDLFENTDNYTIDFLLMGSGNYAKETAQALANKLISVAEIRKDAIAFISPYRAAFISDTSVGTVTVNSDSQITENILSFYSSVSSSSYAIFDSGYKYMYDRFSDTFRYVPLNGDIAGTCARTDINQFPWFSPAGTARGAILNAVKLAYNPSKVQRDRLYSNRINPVIFSPGAGIILFGDKTGLGRASAFDRINVRRLFIYLEDTIARASKDVLFEFNDEITRTNFVNTIEPFLRDIQAKRGIQDYVVICDETNNTAAVIDNNEFIADIYIKPARSINFIGLTFIATKTGVNFEEIIGSV